MAVTRIERRGRPIIFVFFLVFLFLVMLVFLVLDGLGRPLADQARGFQGRHCCALHDAHAP